MDSNSNSTDQQEDQQDDQQDDKQKIVDKVKFANARMAAARKKNERVMERFAEVQRDRIRAEACNSSVTKALPKRENTSKTFDQNSSGASPRAWDVGKPDREYWQSPEREAPHDDYQARHFDRHMERKDYWNSNSRNDNKDYHRSDRNTDNRRSNRYADHYHRSDRNAEYRSDRNAEYRSDRNADYRSNPRNSDYRSDRNADYRSNRKADYCSDRKSESMRSRKMRGSFTYKQNDSDQSQTTSSSQLHMSPKRSRGMGVRASDPHRKSHSFTAGKYKRNEGHRSDSKKRNVYRSHSRSPSDSKHDYMGNPPIQNPLSTTSSMPNSSSKINSVNRPNLSSEQTSVELKSCIWDYDKITEDQNKQRVEKWVKSVTLPSNWSDNRFTSSKDTSWSDQYSAAKSSSWSDNQFSSAKNNNWSESQSSAKNNKWSESQSTAKNNKWSESQSSAKNNKRSESQPSAKNNKWSESQSSAKNKWSESQLSTKNKHWHESQSSTKKKDWSEDESATKNSRKSYSKFERYNKSPYHSSDDDKSDKNVNASVKKNKPEEDTCFSAHDIDLHESKSVNMTTSNKVSCCTTKQKSKRDPQFSSGGTGKSEHIRKQRRFDNRGFKNSESTDKYIKPKPFSRAVRNLNSRFAACANYDSYENDTWGETTKDSEDHFSRNQCKNLKEQSSYPKIREPEPDEIWGDYEQDMSKNVRPKIKQVDDEGIWSDVIQDTCSAGGKSDYEHVESCASVEGKTVVKMKQTPWQGIDNLSDVKEPHSVEEDKSLHGDKNNSKLLKPVVDDGWEEVEQSGSKWQLSDEETNIPISRKENLENKEIKKQHPVDSNIDAGDVTVIDVSTPVSETTTAELVPKLVPDENLNTSEEIPSPSNKIAYNSEGKRVSSGTPLSEKNQNDSDEGGWSTVSDDAHSEDNGNEVEQCKSNPISEK